MSLQDILNKIIEEAEKSVAEIEADTEQKKQELKKVSDAKLAEEKDALDARTASVFESLEKKMQTMARRENAQAMLRAKQEVLEEALDKLITSLEEADDKLYGQFLEKLFVPLAGEEGTILAPEKRIDITKKFAPKGCKVTGDSHIKGGFRATVGGAGIDNTFENLVRSEYRADLITYFADHLKLLA